MAKGYIIEEIRASVRLRDPDSGSTIDVPLETGGHWTQAPGRSEAPRASSEPSQGEERVPRATERSSKQDGAAAKHEPSPKRSDEPEKRRKQHKEKGDRSGRRPARTAETAKPDESESLVSEAARGRRVDIGSLPAEDAEAWKALQANLRHVRTQHGGKKGGLGWKETTDAGRSGLLARSGGGAYKLLHAGSDTYGLFYEWDNGTFERLACGKAEDLMNFANEHARRGPSSPPPTRLSLELARLVCGNAEQKASAAERLEPVFREVDQHPQQAPHPSSTPEPASRTEAATNEMPAPSVASVVVDPKMDEHLMESLKKALAELED